jgi:hypothetical protein
MLNYQRVSSLQVSSILGLSGGAAYAAANGYLDGLAKWRPGQGASDEGKIGFRTRRVESAIKNQPMAPWQSSEMIDIWTMSLEV